MQKLVQGIHQFQSEIFRPQRELFAQFVNGQHPQALFITCCDSRIMPHLVTQAGPGDLFILRTLGNIIPTHGAAGGCEAATIEYALHALGIHDIIICGHSHCGAMKALIEPKSLVGMPRVGRWLRHAEATRQIMLEKYTHLQGNALLTATVEENVLVQLENLRTHPPVAAKLATGELKLHGWVLKIETGQVFHFDPVRHQFVLLAEQETPLPNGCGKHCSTANAVAASAVAASC